jgi:hypothetical protein
MQLLNDEQVHRVTRYIESATQLGAQQGLSPQEEALAHMLAAVGLIIGSGGTDRTVASAAVWAYDTFMRILHDAQAKHGMN